MCNLCSCIKPKWSLYLILILVIFPILIFLFSKYIAINAHLWKWLIYLNVFSISLIPEICSGFLFLLKYVDMWKSVYFQLYIQSLMRKMLMPYLVFMTAEAVLTFFFFFLIPTCSFQVSIVKTIANQWSEQIVMQITRLSNNYLLS